MDTYKFFLTLLLGFAFTALLKSQTPGTLKFSATLTSHNGRYGSSHVVAVWIEDNSGNFVKTRLRMANTNHTINNHLQVWKANSKLNVTDATTGATLRSYSSPLTVAWDGTDVSGNVVADGTYKLFIEESWDEGSSGTSSSSVSFTKDTTSQNLSPANTANFTNMSLSWTPGNVSAITEVGLNDNELKIYPNPSNGTVFISSSVLTDISLIEVRNISGSLVENYRIDKNIVGTKELDLTSFPKGVYFISVYSEDERTVLTKKIILE